MTVTASAHKTALRCGCGGFLTMLKSDLEKLERALISFLVAVEVQKQEGKLPHNRPRLFLVDDEFLNSLKEPLDLVVVEQVDK